MRGFDGVKGFAVRRFALGMGALLCLFSAQVSLAATITVDDDCPLSAAITAANNDSNSHDADCTAGSGADVIALTANVTLTANLPQVTSTITVGGKGHTVDGGNSYHIFYLHSSGNLTINNVTLTQSRSRPGTNNQGGAIFVWQAHVTVTNSAIQNSYAGTDGGAIYAAGTQTTLTVSNSTLSGNRSGSLAGGISFAGAAATLTHVTLSDNESDGASSVIPSGINVESAGLSIRNSIIASSDANQDCFLGTGVSLSHNIGNLIEDNSCSPAATGDPNLSADSRGALLPGSGSPVLGIGNDAICKQYNIDQYGIRRPESNCDAGAVERGGFNDIYVHSGLDDNSPPIAICNLRRAITSANENSAANAEGCVAGVEEDVGRDVIWLQKNVTMSATAPDVSSKIIIDGGGRSVVATSGRLFFVSSGNELTLRNITLRGGQAASGGAAVYAVGKLNLENCVVRDNFHNGGTGGGGALHLSGGGTINRCAFIDNRSDNNGGAIQVSGGEVTISNSLFYKNHSSSYGGAMLLGGGTVTLAHLTIWDNTTSSAGTPTGIQGSSGTIDVFNTIIGRSTTVGGALCGGTFNNSSAERGIQFQRRDASAVGIGWIVAAGFLDAVDVWGWVRPTAEVCFPQAGSTLFINASTTPHTVEQLPSWLDGNSTCASVGVRGLIVLLPLGSPHATSPTAGGAQETLSDCMVTTQARLNLRYEPNGNIIGVVPGNAKLTTFAKKDGWFHVDYYGTRGWISGEYATPNEACG